MLKDVLTKQLSNGFADAIALVRRRRTFDPPEVVSIIQAADGLEARGEPFTREETRVLDVADRLRIRSPESDPEPAIDPAYDRAIAERAAVVAGVELAFQQTRDAWLLAHDAYRRTAATGKEGPTARALQALGTAEQEHRGASDAVERALAQLTGAKLARDRATAAAILGGDRR